jgi:TP901 family phage tail tape measure protein
MSDVDIVLEIATKGVDDIYKLSNAMQQLDKVLRGVANPMKALDARSRALSAAVGSADSSLKAHAKTVGQLSRNNSVLSNELGRVRKEISSMGTDFRYASNASSSFSKTAISDLKAYENSLKRIRVGALAEDLRGVAQEQKRLGKDAQFVGRSLIIGLTTPIVAFGRYGLQALVGVDREFVRLNKVLENVSPNIEAAAKKMNINLTGATKEQSKQLQGMVDRYDRLDKSLTKVSSKFGLAKSITIGLAGDFAELGIQSEESIAKITELTAATEKLGDMDIGAAKDLVQSLYFQAQRAMQMSGQSRNMTFQEREIAAIGAATSQLNLFNSVENVTALTLRDLGDAFPEVAAAGSSFGLSMTELAGMLAPMKAAGFEVGASANSIKVSLQRLVAPTKQNSNLFKDLSDQYKVNFTAIKGTGLDAIQSLIDGFNELRGSAAGQEGAMEFFAKVFGVRQGPRMEVAISQMAEFDSVLKNSTINLDSAEKKLQGFANEAIRSGNVTKDVNLPLINSYKDIGIIARIATAQVKEGETAMIDGFGKVNLEQVKAAREVRKAVTEEIVKAQRTSGEDLIGQVNTEAGRAMFIELAGAANAAEVAQRELDVALGSLDTQLSILKNNFKSFAADIIKGVRPALEKIADISSKLAIAWGNLDGKTKKLISTIVVGFASVTAAIGPLIFVFGQFRLAMSSIAGVIFSFLPSLKTMTVEAVAGSEAMLRLTKPLEVMGDTVVNTNNKFATFIATLASGEGPVGRLANKIGLMTGTLQKTTTAPVSLTREVLATSKKARETLPPLAGGKTPGPVSMGPLGTPVGAPPAASLSARLKSALKLQGSGIMSGAAGVRGAGGMMGPMDPSDRDMLTKVEAMMKQNLVAKGYPTMPGGRGPGGGFSRTVDDMVQDAIRLQAAGTTSGSAGIRTASGRFRRITSGERESLKNFEGTRETLVKRSVAQRALSRKDIDFDIFSDQRSYKGRDISSDRASDIYRGGIKGKMAQFSEATSRARDAGPEKIKELGGKVKGLATAPITVFKKSIDGASTSVMALRAQHAAAGVEGPRMFARMSAAVKGFTTATSFGTQAMKILKLAMITSGIAVILLALAVGFMLIKNNMDKFKEAGAKGLKVVGEAFKIVKNAVMEIIRPVVDLFSHFGNGSEGSAGAVEGIGNAFNKLAGVLKWVAGMFAKLVEVYIKPYMYMIVNIVGAVVSLFQGKWKKAFSFLIAAVAFAVEIFINLFAIAFKIIVSLAGGLVKGVISVFGLLGKGVVELIVWPITVVLKALTSLPLGIGDKFKGVNNAFRGVVNSAKGMVDTATGAVNGVVDKAVSGTNGLINKAAGGLKGKLQGLKKGGIGESKGKIKIGKDDVDTDPMQEQIANATGEGIKTGADKGAKELAKKLAGYAKSLKQELQNDIQDRIKTAMQDVVTAITEGLKGQKEASLKIFDDQLNKIEAVAKAEERLTKAKEYENKKREMEEKRALNQLNSQRNYQLAIYEGRIDDARQISLESQKSEVDSQKEIAGLELSRSQELADERKADLIQSIKDAKDIASKYFDDMIKSFTDAAKKITEFPPTTAEKFNEQLEKLKTAAGDKSKLMGTAFTSSFTGALAALGVDAEGPLTTSLASITAIISKNNPFNATGVWQTTIDASIEGLKQKYIGLTDTLNTAVGESSGKFSELFAIYTKYKDLVAKSEGDAAGGTGGGKGTGNGNAGKPGFNKDGVKIGNKVAIATANANLAAIKTYSDKYLDEKYGKTAEGKKLASAIKGTVGAIASSSVLLGGHDNGMKDFMPVILASKYKDQITTNSELIYAYIMNNRSQFIKGGGAFGRTDENGRSGFFKGGMLSYGDGGKTEGPVQQGIPATLHGGEYVVRNSAVKKYGWGMLQNINQGTYKPKPFENGGMIDYFAKGGKVRKSIVPAARRIPTESPIDTTDPAYKEWQWQQQSGGLNYDFLNAVAKKESAKSKTTKGLPNWTDIGGMRKSPDLKNPQDKSSGGFNMPISLWTALGGNQFGEVPGNATALQQMVINNRHLVFGWFNDKTQTYNTPRGTDAHTMPRYARGAANTSYVPTPESFDPTKSYQDNLVTNKTRVAKTSSANLPMGFATVEGKNNFLKYWERAEKVESTQKIARVQNPFSSPVWIRPKKGLIQNSSLKASNAKTVPTPAGFEYGGVIPEYKIGGAVGGGAGKKIVDKSKLNPFSDVNYKPKNEPVKKKNKGFLGGITDFIEDNTKVFTSTFLSGISAPGEFLVNASMNTLGAMGVGKKQSNDSVFQKIFTNSIKETSLFQRGVALKKMITTGEDPRVLMGLDRGWNGLGGYLPMQSGADAFKEQAKNRNILGQGTTFTPGGALAYLGLNKVVGGITKKISGKQAEFTKEGSGAYGVTQIAGDILADTLASPGGGKSIANLGKTLINPKKALFQKFPKLQEYLLDFKQSNLTPFFPKNVYSQSWGISGLQEPMYMPHVNAVAGRTQLQNNFRIEQSYQRLAPRVPRPGGLVGDLPPMPAGMTGRDIHGFDITHAKPFRNIFQEAGANKFVRQSAGASKAIFPTLPRILSRKLTAGMSIHDWLGSLSYKGAARVAEQADIRGIINSVQRQNPELLRGYKIPENTRDSAALFKQRIANKIKDIILPKDAVESIGTTMGPNPLKLAEEARVRAIKQAQALELRERVLANIAISKKGRSGLLNSEKAFKLEELKRMGLDVSSLEDLGGYSSSQLMNMIKDLNPGELKRIINDNYAITNTGDGFGNAGGYGSHAVTTWRKNTFQYPGRPYAPWNPNTAQSTAKFTFDIQDLVDELNPANGLVKTLNIQGMYAKQGVGQVDIYHLLGYLFDEFIVKHGIKQVKNGSYSSHSLSMSHMFSEVMKVLRPQTKVITPNLMEWSTVSGRSNPINFDSVNSVLHDQAFMSSDELDAFMMPSGINPVIVEPRNRMTNLVTGAGGKIKSAQTIKKIMAIRKKLKKEGMIFPSAKKIQDMKAEIELSESYFNPVNPYPHLTIPLDEMFNGGLIRGFANGGAVPGFGSAGFPAMLHGGEYVVNSSAVKNIGFAALQAMNDMRFNTPKAPAYSGPVQPQQNSTSSVNIYVDNFIGEKQWFESMMKDYNINVGPQNQKTAGLQSRTISTYNGLNRGL